MPTPTTSTPRPEASPISGDARRSGAGLPRQRPTILCVGGEDHGLRLPFLLRLRADGFDVQAAADCDPRPFEEACIPLRPYSVDRSLNPAADWAAIQRLSAIVGATAPDIVQSFDTKPNLYVAMLARHHRSARIVRTINGTGRVYSSPRLRSRALRPIYDLAQRQATRAGAVTVFQNEADRSLFLRKRMVRPESTRLIKGSGIDVEAFDRAARAGANPAHLRQQLGLTASNIVITVTRIEPLKGIGTLLAAAELVHAVDPDTQFVLVGPWEEGDTRHSQLRELCRRSRSLRWIGPRSDVQALLGLATAFVLPTEFREGLPRVLLEAALAGLPIVTTDMPGCMSVVEHGANGFAVPPRSPGAVAAAVLELLGSPDLARRFGSCGAARVRREFSLTSVTRQYGTLYRNLLRSAD